MACSVVGMLDGHDFIALEDQRLVAYIDFRDVGIGWSAAVMYQSLAVDARVAGVGHGGIVGAGTSSRHEVIGGVLSLGIDFHLVCLLSEFFFHFGNLRIQGIALGVVGESVVDIRALRSLLLFQLCQTGTEHRDFFLCQLCLYLHVVRFLYSRRQDVGVILVDDVAQQNVGVEGITLVYHFSHLLVYLEDVDVINSRDGVFIDGDVSVVDRPYHSCDDIVCRQYDDEQEDQCEDDLLPCQSVALRLEQVGHCLFLWRAIILKLIHSSISLKIVLLS